MPNGNYLMKLFNITKTAEISIRTDPQERKLERSMLLVRQQLCDQSYFIVIMLYKDNKYIIGL